MSPLAKSRQIPRPIPVKREYPALLWVDPARLGGSVAVYGTRLNVEMVAGYVWRGDVDDFLFSWDYVDKPRVLGACWWIACYGGEETWCRDAVNHWADWLDAHHGDLCRMDYDAIPYPPAVSSLPTED